MKHSLGIVVADDELSMVEFMQKGLSLLGHRVLGAAHTGRELVERCRACHPDLVITDIKMPDMNGLQAAAEIYLHHAIPVIIVSAFYDQDLIEQASANHIAAYLIKPIRHGDLEPAIGLAVRRFEEFQTLQKEASDLRQALEDRKVIERAKGLLMRKAGLDEQGAFHRLQQLSRSKRMKMSAVASMIVMAEEACAPPGMTEGSTESA